MLPEPLPEGADRVSMERAGIERAIRACVDFFGDPPPRHITTLRAPRYKGESSVFRLGSIGPGGRDVVAKELPTGASLLEKTVYSQILPHLSAGGPRLFGTIDSIDPGRVWLFLEVIGGPALDESDPAHVAIASSWLARFQSETMNCFDALLPKRDAEYYSSLASSTLLELEEVSLNQELTSTQTEVLRRVSAHIEKLLDSFDLVADLYSSSPKVVVHGDFKDDNMAFSVVDGKLELNVFDWSDSHTGPMAVDLWWIDRGVYARELRRQALPVAVGTIEEWQRFAAIIRWLTAVAWKVPPLRYEWVETPMRRMALYESRLRAAIEDSSWVS